MTYKSDLEAEPCRCISCPDCAGSGNMWVTLDGQYHTHRCDDMGDLETCENCRGSGIIETCDRCMELEQIDQDEKDAQDRNWVRIERW